MEPQISVTVSQTPKEACTVQAFSVIMTIIGPLSSNSCLKKRVSSNNRFGVAVPGIKLHPSTQKATVNFYTTFIQIHQCISNTDNSFI